MENKQGLGIASLICGVIGFFIFGIPLGFAAIITGVLSLETKLGKAGLIIGIIDIIGVMLLLS